mmetsp:Transcript_5129/g.5647  ORF Transcript_5129/g.5647 Transcript_5129/m.5647 type:complete len:94 (-) Transcript_5129:134-415(-)
MRDSGVGSRASSDDLIKLDANNQLFANDAGRQMLAYPSETVEGWTCPCPSSYCTPYKCLQQKFEDDNDNNDNKYKYRREYFMKRETNITISII